MQYERAFGQSYVTIRLVHVARLRDNTQQKPSRVWQVERFRRNQRDHGKGRGELLQGV